jgi:nucleotide-binding universal stress UspA family protein
MKKILVPTDFSANSESGVRFAIHWASEQKLELVFIHILHILRPISWSDSYFEKYAEQEEKMCRAKLENFIAGIYINMNAKPGNHSFLIIQGYSADVSILDYCRTNKDIDYICISTRGAGRFNKLFGTNTSNLVTKSTIPVLAIPGTYEASDIKTVLYASDFHNNPAELKKVVDFALPFKATIEVLHFTWPDEITFDEKSIEAAFKKEYEYDLKMHFEKNDAAHSLVENLQNQIRIRNPSVVIMFTNQERTLFQRIFFSSKTEELSFHLKVPLLVFNK